MSLSSRQEAETKEKIRDLGTQKHRNQDFKAYIYLRVKQKLIRKTLNGTK